MTLISPDSSEPLGAAGEGSLVGTPCWLCLQASRPTFCNSQGALLLVQRPSRFQGDCPPRRAGRLSLS